jgi:signal peptidase II
MNPVVRNRVFGLILAAVICGLDRLAKLAMIGPLHLREVGQVYVMPFFQFTYTENYGVSLSLLTADTMEMRYLLIALTGLIALGVLVWLLRETRMWDIAAFGLILGGAAGNIYDRWHYGYVIDFLDLHFGQWRPFLIFNTADAAITLGVVIILARSLFLREKRSASGPDTPSSEQAAETN